MSGFGGFLVPARSRVPTEGNLAVWYEEEFLSNGTFTVPTRVTEVFVDMCAGGGGGASSAGTDVGGGGQAGEFCWKYKVAVSPGEEIAITIGAGGSGGASGGDNHGVVGSDSSFGAYITVNGGDYGKFPSEALGVAPVGRGGGTGHGYGYSNSAQSGGGPIIKSGTLAGENLICYGPAGGGGEVWDHVGGAGGSNPFSGYGGPGTTGKSGGGGGLFGAGTYGGVNAAANSGAGGGGGHSAITGGNGGSGKCVVRWQK